MHHQVAHHANVADALGEWALAHRLNGIERLARTSAQLLKEAGDGGIEALHVTDLHDRACGGGACDEVECLG